MGLAKLDVLIMVLAQSAYASIAISYKYASQHGFSLRVVVALRLLIATIILLPVAAILHWRRRGSPNAPVLSWKVLGLALLCALFRELVSSNAYVWSLKVGSTATATAMLNLGPAFTFILSILLKMENLSFHSKAGKAKVAGTLIALSGAMTTSFYKGPTIHYPMEFILYEGAGASFFHKTSHHQGLSIVLAFGSCLSSSTASIIQAKLLKSYKSSLGCSALIITMGALQCLICAAIVDNQQMRFIWRWSTMGVMILLTGLLGSGLMTVLTSRVMEKKGPFFVSVFSPLSLILVALVSPILLGETLRAGSIIGGVIITSGVCLVLWGKQSENKAQNNNNNREGQAEEEAQQTEQTQEARVPVEELPSPPFEQEPIPIEEQGL